MVFPERFRLLPDASVEAYENGILVHTLSLQRIVIHNETALLRSLVSRLRLWCSLEELDKEFKFPSGISVVDIIAGLRQAGVIQPESLSVSSNESAASRFLSLLGFPDDHDRVANVRVVIYEPEPFGDLAASCVEALESLHVQTRFERGSRMEQWQSTTLSGEGRRVIVVPIMDYKTSHSFRSDINDWCMTNRVEWLRVVTFPFSNTIEVGPLFRIDKRTCYECLSEAYPVSIHSGFGSGLSSSTIAWWAALITTQILLLIGAPSECTVENALCRYISPILSPEEHRWTIGTGCLSLGPDGAHVPSANRGITIVEAFDRSLCSASRTGRHVSHEPKYFEEQKLRSFSIKRPNSERNLLANWQAAGPIGSRVGARYHQVDAKAALSLILGSAVGLTRSSESKNWYHFMPTAGNLWSQELLLAVRGSESLQAGFYSYDPLEHALVSVATRVQQPTVDQFINQATRLEPGEIEAIIICVGAYERLSRKYEHFAYRLIFLDCGICIAQLMAAASLTNRSTYFVPEFRYDLIAELFNLKRDKECVTSVIALGRSPLTARAERYPLLAGGGLEDAARRLSSSEISAFDMSELYGMVRSEIESEAQRSTTRATRLDRAKPRLRARFAELSLFSQRFEFKCAHMSSRRSVRDFSSERIEIEILRRIVARGCSVIREVSDAAAQSCFYFLTRIHRTQSESFRWSSTPANVRHVDFERELLPSEPAVALLEGKRRFDSPGAVIILVDMRRLIRSLGTPAYQSALVIAGMAAHQMWEIAREYGLDGVLHAGMAAELQGLRFSLCDYPLDGLLAFLFGVKADEPAIL